MFDFAPDAVYRQDAALPRVLALDLIARSGARLRMIASRLGGRRVGQPAASKDIQTDRLIDQIERIRDRIGQEPDARAA